MGRCIESIEHQDIPQTEYEVICVDDCSKDNTVEVIKEYQKQYPNIRLICHEVNKTAGGARNTGIEAAKGEYLWFVDPDDMICPRELSAIYSKAHEDGAEILFFNYQTQKETGETVCTKYPLCPKSMSGENYVKFCAGGKISLFISIYSSLILRSFLCEKHIRYPQIRAGQDVVFVWLCLLNAKMCMEIDEICYTYIRRSSSVTGSRGRLNAQAIFSQSLLFASEVNEMIRCYPTIDREILEELSKAIRYALNNDSRNILYASREQKMNFYEMMHRHTELIHLLWHNMNRRTQKIFNLHRGYYSWYISLLVIRVMDIIRRRSSRVYYE